MNRWRIYELPLVMDKGLLPKYHYKQHSMKPDLTPEWNLSILYVNPHKNASKVQANTEKVNSNFCTLFANLQIRYKVNLTLIFG